MVLIDNFKVMDISDNFFDAHSIGDDATHSMFCWWDFKEHYSNSERMMKETMSEKEIYMTTVMSKLGLLAKDFVGIEYWWSTRKVGGGLAVHQDKDEMLYEREKIMVHPLMSIVTFPKEALVEGGDHFFVDEKFGTKEMDFQNFTESMYQRISYKHNRLIIVSPGNLFHGVLPIERGERSAFVMNLWDRKVESWQQQ